MLIRDDESHSVLSARSESLPCIIGYIKWQEFPSHFRNSATGAMLYFPFVSCWLSRKKETPSSKHLFKTIKKMSVAKNHVC